MPEQTSPARRSAAVAEHRLFVVFTEASLSHVFVTLFRLFGLFCYAQQVSVQPVTPSKSSGCPFGRRRGVFPCATGRSRRMQNPRAPHRRSTPALTWRVIPSQSSPFAGKPLRCVGSTSYSGRRRGLFSQVAGLDASPFPTYDWPPLRCQAAR